MCERALCNLLALDQKLLAEQGAGIPALADDILGGHRAWRPPSYFKAGAHPTLSHRTPVNKADDGESYRPGRGAAVPFDTSRDY